MVAGTHAQLIRIIGKNQPNSGLENGKIRIVSHFGILVLTKLWQPADNTLSYQSLNL
ncbi:hypothetical Protein YC6258_05960 [Gynuella sunshinyii YC6258]|uniref:Uncharacterized protein n=1 Tax=Gynuella sunshinyii YC6258 TaxID=1445510 RepID=A0A0C5W5V5_9GAMM|nr:hypothetical Protein YC6258_05960 [Gynuella sunshinyii YC6258]